VQTIVDQERQDYYDAVIDAQAQTAAGNFTLPPMSTSPLLSDEFVDSLFHIELSLAPRQFIDTFEDNEDVFEDDADDINGGDQEDVLDTERGDDPSDPSRSDVIQNRNNKLEDDPNPEVTDSTDPDNYDGEGYTTGGGSSLFDDETLVPVPKVSASTLMDIREINRPDFHSSTPMPDNYNQWGWFGAKRYPDNPETDKDENDLIYNAARVLYIYSAYWDLNMTVKAPDIQVDKIILYRHPTGDPYVEDGTYGEAYRVSAACAEFGTCVGKNEVFHEAACLIARQEASVSQELGESEEAGFAVDVWGSDDEEDCGDSDGNNSEGDNAEEAEEDRKADTGTYVG